MNIAAYPKHHSFKPSGFDWLGDVPAHWDVEKLGSMLTAVSEKNHPDLPLLSITREQGVIERDVEDQDSNHNFIPDDLSGYKVLREGQFGMNKMKAWQGSYGVSAHTGIVSPAYFIFDFAREVDPHFFNIAIRSKLYVSYFGSASDGVRIGQWDLNQSRMRQIPLLLPPLPEQRAIAAFLDGKCATIDEAVRIKEEQIRLLAERRNILIQQAVTRGLNPNAPMKDSGIDWIGQIPAHWSIAKLKFLTNKIVDGTHFTPEYLDEGIPFLRVTDLSQMKEGKIQWDSVRRISMNAHKELSKRANAEFGDVLLSKNGTIGLTKVIDWQDEFSFFVSLCLIKLRSELNAHYFEAFFNSPLVDQQLFFGSFRTSVTNLHLERIKELLIVVPPIEEQRELVEHISEISSPLDEAITLKQTQITALREYKTSLINAAVTGKIKVF